MCKCCQYCLESCYWHLIEKRFCYDESIALYEVPEKQEKNNNMFDNMAFFDSISVIAGRSIVRIDPLPTKEQQQPIIKQPTRSLRWEEESRNENNKGYLSKSVPVIYQTNTEDDNNTSDNKKAEISCDSIDGDDSLENIAQTKQNIIEQKSNSDNNLDILKPESSDPEMRRKLLRERRLSKSLYLRIDQPKELPLIRQQSMPKFYLDTPSDEHYSHSILRTTTPPAALTSPVIPNSSDFVYDLYSVVQMEKERAHNLAIQQQQQQQHHHHHHHHHQPNSSGNIVNLSKDDSRASRLALIKEKIKLRRVKSTLGTLPMNLPHSHNHI